MLAHILTNPTIYQKLQSEIDTALSSGQVSSPVTDAEARQLPYLQACIREGLRIWPPIPGLNPRVAAVDTELCGVPIPAGTNVAWSSRTVLCSKAIFGPDARMFRPERWLEADPDQFHAMENTVDLAFGQGRWSCLGKPIALIEINKVLVEVSSMSPRNHTYRWEQVLTSLSSFVALILKSRVRGSPLMSPSLAWSC